jgi:putative transposase
VVGVDVGVTYLAVLSTGEHIVNPTPLQGAHRRVRRLNRRLARQRGPLSTDGTRQSPSHRWQQTKTRLARQHGRVANLRRNALHQLTSRLARQYGAVAIERLNVAGMVRNHHLARAISDAGLGEIRRQLAYKTVWNGGRLVQADPWYPSSKTCSGCGWVKPKLTLAERTFRCESCDLIVDRDLNAARNLAALVRLVARSGWETQTARGEDVSPGLAGRTLVKREAGTTLVGETGTGGP